MSRARITFDPDAGRYRIDIDEPGVARTARLEIGDRISTWSLRDGTVVTLTVDLELDERGVAPRSEDLAVLALVVGDDVAASLVGRNTEATTDRRTARVRNIVGRLAWRASGVSVSDRDLALVPASIARQVDPTLLAEADALPIEATAARDLSQLVPEVGLVAEQAALVHPDGSVSRGGEVLLPAIGDVDRYVDLRVPARLVWSETTGEVDVRVVLLGRTDAPPTELWARISHRVEGRILALAPVDDEGTAATVLALDVPDLSTLFIDVTRHPLDPPGSATSRARDQAATLAEAAARAEDDGDARQAGAAWEAAAAVWASLGEDALAGSCRAEAERMRGQPRRRRWRLFFALLITMAILAAALAFVATRSGGTGAPSGAGATTTSSTASLPATPTVASSRFMGVDVAAHIRLKLLDTTITADEPLRLVFDVSPTDNSGWNAQGATPYEDCLAQKGRNASIEDPPFQHAFNFTLYLAPTDQPKVDDVASYTTSPAIDGDFLDTGNLPAASQTRSRIEVCSPEPHPTKPGFLSAWARHSYTQITATITLPPSIAPGEYRLAPLPIDADHWASGEPLHLTIT